MPAPLRLHGFSHLYVGAVRCQCPVLVWRVAVYHPSGGACACTKRCTDTGGGGGRRAEWN